MPFQSSRFAGEPTLEEILADPDSGTKKLMKHSPAEPVRRVQQGLFDLGWAVRVDPPVISEGQFVDGDYGPATERTAHAFKTYFGLTFPPGDPNGFIDGYTGPTTLARLDERVVLFDTLNTRIDDKVAALVAEGVDVDRLELTPPAATILGTDGQYAPTSGPFAAEGAIWTEPYLGPHFVVRQIYHRYMELRHALGHLGFPIGDVQVDGDVETCEFEGGNISYFQTTDEVVVTPPA